LHSFGVLELRAQPPEHRLIERTRAVTFVWFCLRRDGFDGLEQKSEIQQRNDIDPDAFDLVLRMEAAETAVVADW